MVHKAAAVGYEKRSSTYAAARPDYHSEVLDVVADAVDPSIGRGVTIDLGAGTGISTAALIARGLTVRAVEPVAAMRAALEANVPEADVRAGTAESIPAPDGAAAAIVVAQAFHWFKFPAALDEIARALGVGGVLITLWNVRDETVPWMAAYTGVQDVVQGDTPRYRDMHWRQAIEADSRFSLQTEVRVPNPQPSNVDHTVGRFLSTSFIASQSAKRQAGLEAEIRDIVAELGTEFVFPYNCEAQIWKRQQ